MSEVEVDFSGSINGRKPQQEADQQEVEIILKTIGPLRPRLLKVPPYLKVHDLRKLLAENECLPVSSLSLILRGTVLNDKTNGEDIHVKLKNGDSLVVAVKRKAPPKRICDDDDDDDGDEDDLNFQLPESTTRWKWKLFCLLRDKLKLPDLVLMAIFSLSLKAWALIFLWFVLAPVAHKWDIGPLYILGTGFAIIFCNLGQRQEGDLSAYSIFNEEFRELPGTLNAERLDRDIRAGQF